MGMESVYKLSVILNLVDNLSSQMNGVQSSVSNSVNKLNSAFGTMQKAGVAMAGVGGAITGLAMKTVTATKVEFTESNRWCLTGIHFPPSFKEKKIGNAKIKVRDKLF